MVLTAPQREMSATFSLPDLGHSLHDMDTAIHRQTVVFPPESFSFSGWDCGMTVAVPISNGGESNMKKTFGSALMALAFVFGVIAATGSTANAQWSNRTYGGYNNQDIQQGFQYGANVGASDAQRRQSYSPQRSRYYRDAPTQAFRDGFVRGYDQGYRQYANNNGGYGNGGYGNNGDYGNGGYGNNGDYGNGGYGNGGYSNQELNAGYQQGINTGADDGRRNKQYGPERSKYYRNARTQAYREGFVRGYDAGYRQYSGNRSYRRSNTAAQILGQILGVRY